jgi:hypothetical protein
LEFGVIPFVPAPVVAQVSRSPQQAQLRRSLSGCAVVPLSESEAHEAGLLLGKTRTTDVVDSVVVITAIRQKALILTGDEQDIKQLVAASGRTLVVLPV